MTFSTTSRETGGEYVQIELSADPHAFVRTPTTGALLKEWEGRDSGGPPALLGGLPSVAWGRKGKASRSRAQEGGYRAPPDLA
jgi:hypothetical protein